MIFANLATTIGIATRLIAPTLPWSTGPTQLFYGPQATAHVVSVRKPNAKASVVAKHLLPATSVAAPDARGGQMLYDPQVEKLLLGVTATNGKYPLLGHAADLIAAGDDADAESVLVTTFAKYPEDEVAMYLAEEMVKRGDWTDAAQLLTRPNRDHSEPSYPFLEAAVLAHQGYVFSGERAALLDAAGIEVDPSGQTAAVARMRGVPVPPGSGHFARFPSELPHDVESLAWYLGAINLAGKGGREARELMYARRSLAMNPGDPAVLGSFSSCLNRLGKYSDVIRLLGPYSHPWSREMYYAVGAEYDSARKKLAAQGP